MQTCGAAAASRAAALAPHWQQQQRRRQRRAPPPAAAADVGHASASRAEEQAAAAAPPAVPLARRTALLGAAASLVAATQAVRPRAALAVQGLTAGRIPGISGPDGAPCWAWEPWLMVAKPFLCCWENGCRRNPSVQACTAHQRGGALAEPPARPPAAWLLIPLPPAADGYYTYQRPEGKSGGHGVGWSEIQVGALRGGPAGPLPPCCAGLLGARSAAAALAAGAARWGAS